MSSNGKRRDGASAYGKRASAARVARQLARDAQTRAAPPITLPRVRSLELEEDAAAQRPLGGVP